MQCIGGQVACTAKETKKGQRPHLNALVASLLAHKEQKKEGATKNKPHKVQCMAAKLLSKQRKGRGQTTMQCIGGQVSCTKKEASL